MNDVLVIGAGPVGLTTALLLARRGVGVLVLERHPGTTLHPKALGLSLPSWEIFREAGIDGAVRSVAAEFAGLGGKVAAPSLVAARPPAAGPRAAGTALGDLTRSISPAAGSSCPQDRLE